MMCVCVYVYVIYIYTNFITIAMCMCPVRYMFIIRMYIYAPLFNYCNNKKKHDDVVIAVVAIQESR